MRSVAGLGHSNGLVQFGSRLFNMLDHLGDAAPEAGRTPVTWSDGFKDTLRFPGLHGRFWGLC
jgi:hypothetical protein